MHPDSIDTLNLMESGLNISRETVKEVHNFRDSLLAIQSIAGHVMEEEQFEALDFFLELAGMTNDLLVDLEVEEKGEIHLIAKGEAVKKRGAKWIIRHQIIVGKEIRKETEHEEKIIEVIKSHMEQIIEHFRNHEDEFIHNEEIKDLFRRLSRLFNFYLSLFSKELERLRRLK